MGVRFREVIEESPERGLVCIDVTASTVITHQMRVVNYVAVLYGDDIVYVADRKEPT